MLRIATTLSVLAVAVAAKDHEWAGIFETSDSSYTWIAQKVGGAYADPSMKMVVLPATAATDAALEALETEAGHGFAATCTDVTNGGTIIPKEDACYLLKFDDSMRESTFTIDTSSNNMIAFFTEHGPTEFEDATASDGKHYFQTVAGADVEPKVQESASGHDHHGHGGGGPYEWGGIFATPEKWYTWTAQKKDGSYADPEMKMVVLKASASTDAALKGLETEAEHSMEATCVTVNNGGTLTPKEDACYTIVFDGNTHTSMYYVDAAGADAIAFFTAHHPIEFERDAHYLKDDHGDDIEPDAEVPEEVPTTVSKPWGLAIGASFIVNICTFIGIVFLVPCVTAVKNKYPSVVFTLVNAFAAGALMAAAFYLMFYEATHLIPMTNGEAQACALWGSMIIAGFLTASIIDIIVSGIFGASAEPSTSTAKVEPSDTASAVTVAPFSDRIRVLSGVLVGDFMHNFVDGIVIGTAFIGCGDAMAWGITGATVAHELAQELADYLVLTDPKQGGLKPVMALIFNFISGLSVVLGAIVVLSQDKIDYETQGYLLAYGGGVYVQIGCAEAMPRANQLAKSMVMKLSTLATFLFGAFAIGIVLVSHEHCVPSGGDGHDHGGDGHNH